MENITNRNINKVNESAFDSKELMENKKALEMSFFTSLINKSTNLYYADLIFEGSVATHYEVKKLDYHHLDIKAIYDKDKIKRLYALAYTDDNNTIIISDKYVVYEENSLDDLSLNNIYVFINESKANEYATRANRLLFNTRAKEGEDK